ncbi:MAG: Peroxiredoxin [Fibrobacteres bacterium]|nr:Peroxiredoxin [Fibrobacterota bacterium]
MKNWVSASAKAATAFLFGAALLGAANVSAAGKVGEMAADFTGLKALDGKTYNLHDYKGKVVMVMTVQWNCGGCNANAPAVGALAYKFKDKAFQAFGPDINFATTEQLGTFDKNLKKTEPKVAFPLLMGIPKADIKDSIKGTANFGTVWVPYNALRDVYFVIDHTGKIMARIEGDRGNPMGAVKMKALEDSIAAAISRVPTTGISVSGNNDLCLRACKRSGQYQIDLDPSGTAFPSDVSLRIMDSQGRLIRSLDWNGWQSASQVPGGRQAIWDGMDSQGRTVAWGSYYLNATSAATSVSLLLSWLP